MRVVELDTTDVRVVELDTDDVLVVDLMTGLIESDWLVEVGKPSDVLDELAALDSVEALMVLRVVVIVVGMVLKVEHDDTVIAGKKPVKVEVEVSVDVCVSTPELTV